MRRYLLTLPFLMTAVLTPACGEHGVAIDFPAQGVSLIPIEDEPSFVDRHERAAPEVVSIRIHGMAIAPLAGHPPENREELEAVARDSVNAHEHHMTRALIDHVERTLEHHGRTDLRWQTTRILGAEIPMKIESSALRVRYEYELHLRASPELFALLAPHQRVDPSFVLHVSDSWWGDSESEVTLSLSESAAPDAFLPYLDMAKDGAIDIAVHVGDAADLETPAKVRIEEAGLSLIAKGWKRATSSRLATLEMAETPFTREVSFDGELSELRVMLFKENSRTRDLSWRLSSSLMTSLSKRDIVILRDLEPSLEAAVADAIGLGSASANTTLTNESGAKLIIVHSTSESAWVDQGIHSVRGDAGRDVIEFGSTTTSDDAILDALVAGLTLTDSTGRHVPLSIGSLHRLAAKHTEEALHLSAWGLHDNPRTNPYGAHDELCAPCSGPNHCGSAGNLCVYQDGAGACGLACASELSCPSGYRCATVVTDTGLDFLPRQCVPRAGACGI